MSGALRNGCLITVIVLATTVSSARATGRVLVLDAGEEHGSIADDLDLLASRVESERGLVVLGPSFASPFVTAAPDLPSSAEVESLLQLAERQYEDFDTTAARETLVDASRRIGNLTDGEHGELVLRFHWLFAQLAIVEGEDATAATHLERIVHLAPWWEPPKGYLTPEASAVFGALRTAAVTAAAVVDLTAVAPDAAVWVDGFPMKDYEAVRVAPGLHLVRVERPGYSVWRRWFELAPGQTLTVQSPVIPRWDDEVRASVRAAMTAGDAATFTQLVGGLAELADASLVVVAFPAGGRISAAAVSTTGQGWVVGPTSGALSELAGALCGVKIASSVRTPSRLAMGVFTLSIGGSGRVVGDADEFVVPGSGPVIELGGGVAINDILEIRVLGGVSFHGGSSLSLPLGGTSVESRQRSYLVRVGAVIGPRIPLGGAAYLWVGGGGGLGVAGLSGSLGDGTTTSVSAAGGMVMAKAFLGLSPWPGLRFGPTAGFVLADAPTSLLMHDGGTAARIKTGPYSAVEFGMQMALGR